MPTGTHDLVAKDGTPVRKGRISPELRTAITLIVHEGLTVADAAKRTGYQTESLSKALIKPHVKAFRASVKRAWLDSKTERAWLNMARLADSACSEDVQYKSNKTFLEAAGELGGPASDPNATARTLVQIVINAAQNAGHLPAGQMSGVIEAEPYQPVEPHPSNLRTVGRVESEPDDDR